MAHQPSNGTAHTVTMSEFNARAKRLVADKAEPARHARQVFARSAESGRTSGDKPRMAAAKG